MDIVLEARGSMREMTAPAGYYLTQAAVGSEDRIFCTRRVLLPSEQAEEWRPATPREKADYEAETARLYPTATQTAAEAPESRSEAPEHRSGAPERRSQAPERRSGAPERRSEAPESRSGADIPDPAL
ncbi:hypothetical protein [Alistipes sp.]|uniref:hypothetical protein n=1 Tax=Alistipes sp. TaxID=1872444 RepID=UPI003AF134DD